MVSGRSTDDELSLEEQFPEPVSYKRIKTDESQVGAAIKKTTPTAVKFDKLKKSTQLKKQTKLARGATAIIASLGFMAAANQAGGSTSQS